MLLIGDVLVILDTSLELFGWEVKVRTERLIYKLFFTTEPFVK